MYSKCINYNTIGEITLLLLQTQLYAFVNQCCKISANTNISKHDSSHVLTFIMRERLRQIVAGESLFLPLNSLWAINKSVSITLAHVICQHSDQQMFFLPQIPVVISYHASSMYTLAYFILIISLKFSIVYYLFTAVPITQQFIRNAV